MHRIRKTAIISRNRSESATGSGKVSKRMLGITVGTLAHFPVKVPNALQYLNNFRRGREWPNPEADDTILKANKISPVTGHGESCASWL